MSCYKIYYVILYMLMCLLSYKKNLEVNHGNYHEGDPIVHCLYIYRKIISRFLGDLKIYFVDYLTLMEVISSSLIIPIPTSRGLCN